MSDEIAFLKLELYKGVMIINVQEIAAVKITKEHFDGGDHFQGDLYKMELRYAHSGMVDMIWLSQKFNDKNLEEVVNAFLGTNQLEPTKDNEDSSSRNTHRRT